MAENQLILVTYHGKEVGKIGRDENRGTTSFQYHPEFLKEENYLNLFPFIFRKTPYAQVFNDYNNETFRGLPPMIADSLPDLFGNLVFNQWWQQNKGEKEDLTVLEQLTYVANRGIGALEFQPIHQLPSLATIDLEEITKIARQVVELKQDSIQEQLDEEALFNIFKMGTSVGGARPKVLISEHKKTGHLIPGDIEFSDEYYHYIVKLDIDDSYSRTKVEFIYYQLAEQVGIEIMPSFLIADKHFATHRFDRQNGVKQHVLTVSGMTGWDFTKPEYSSYENIFKLAVNLNVPHRDIQELFKRMIFNVVFANFDDHLKNFSFLFEEESNSWRLSPAYDLTFPADARMTYKRMNHACSINGKRNDFNWKDMEQIALQFSVKEARNILEDVLQAVPLFKEKATELGLSTSVIEGIESKFTRIDQ